MTSHEIDQRSVTEWLHQLKQGVEGEPQQQIVARFLHRLEALARSRLKNLRSYEDEQDIALSALNSFLMRATDQDYCCLNDRKSLWSLLAAITINKAITTQRKQLAAKRDVRREVNLEVRSGQEPTREFLDSVVHEGNRLLDSIDDELLRKIARMRMEGYSNQDIATSIQRSVKTVERKLQLIRKKLQTELDRSDE